MSISHGVQPDPTAFLQHLRVILAERQHAGGSVSVPAMLEGEAVTHRSSLAVAWGSSFKVQAYRASFGEEPPTWALSAHPHCLTLLLGCAIDCARPLPDSLADVLAAPKGSVAIEQQTDVSPHAPALDRHPP